MNILNDPQFAEWHTLYLEFQRVSDEVKNAINKSVKLRSQEDDDEI